MNSVGLSGQPCLTPSTVQNDSVNVSPILTKFSLSSYISFILSIISLLSIVIHSIVLVILLNAASRSTKNVNTLLRCFSFFYVLQHVYVVNGTSALSKSGLNLWQYVLRVISDLKQRKFLYSDCVSIIIIS